MKPPPVIGNARVLEYALVGDAVFTGTLCIYVNNERVGAVPKLAICESFAGDELFLLHCDSDWSIRAIQAWTSKGVDGSSVAEIKRRAEKYYAGISERWIRHDASSEDVEQYRESLIGDLRCSFCGRTIFDVGTLLEGNGARICNLCVIDFYEEITVDKSSG